VVVLEAGWVTAPGVERRATSRMYDTDTGHLLGIVLGCERWQ